MSGDFIEETSTFNELTGEMVVKTTYDNTTALKDARLDRDAKPEGFGKYKSGNSQLIHVGSIHLGDVARLRNMGYNLLAADPDERRRALCYIQTNEPHLLSVSGKPFARERKKWA